MYFATSMHDDETLDILDLSLNCYLKIITLSLMRKIEIEKQRQF